MRDHREARRSDKTRAPIFPFYKWHRKPFVSGLPLCTVISPCLERCNASGIASLLLVMQFILLFARPALDKRHELSRNGRSILESRRFLPVVRHIEPKSARKGPHRNTHDRCRS